MSTCHEVMYIDDDLRSARLMMIISKEDLVIKPECVEQLAPFFPSLSVSGLWSANDLIWIAMMMMMMTTMDTCLHNLTSPQRISMPRSTSGVNKVRTKIDKETKKNNTKTTPDWHKAWKSWTFRSSGVPAARRQNRFGSKTAKFKSTCSSGDVYTYHSWWIDQ